jgi:hypothetical protein
MVKNLLKSKIFRLLLSAALIYFAFKRVNVSSLVGNLVEVPIWFVTVILIYSFLGMLYGSARWCLIVLGKISLKDALFFSKINLIGGFYSLFLSSSVGGDFFKWAYLHKKYQEISKTRLGVSVIVDRVIGFSAFGLVAFLMMVLGKVTGFQFPNYLFWLFLAIALAILFFYGAVFYFDFEKRLGKFTFLKKLLKLLAVLEKENKKIIFQALIMSFFGQLLWALPFWFYSLVFGAGMSLLSIYVLVPVISLILVLPISVAGFGAREQLFLYFFGPLGIVDEKILLVSSFAGVVVLLMSLLGGLLMLL